MALSPEASQSINALRYGIGHDWGVYNTFSWFSRTAGTCRGISNDIITTVRRHRIMY